MALDPNIILRAGNYKSIDPGQLLETRAQLQMRNAAAAKAQRDEQMVQAKTVRLGQVGTIAATGDYAGATRVALQAGDFDLAKHVGEMDDRSKAVLAAKVGVAAPVFATALTEADPAKRTQIIAAALPTLKANGYTDDEIAKINPTDEFLRGAVANAQSIGDIIKHQEFLTTEAGKTEDRTIRREDQRLDRDNARGNAYIAAGLLPPDAPGGGGALGGAGGGSGGTTAGRTQYGWTPRSRNGGDNTDAAVDNKIAGMSKALGRDPDAPLTGMTPLQIAQALTLSEGGAGSIADKNSNPGNLRDPKTLAYRRFPTKQAGLEAAAAQVRRNLARGQTTIRTMVEGLPAGGSGAGGSGLRVIPGGKLDKSNDDLTPDAMERAAIVYGTTGQMPQGLGRAGVTQKAILNKWAEIASKGGVTPQEQVANWQQQKASGKAVQAFASGPQGNTVRSLNVAIDHLDTLQNAAQALQNGNIQVFNKVAQKFAQATGRTPPANFEAIRGIVGDELVKAIVGGGNAGALADREEMKATINNAQSPQQLAGVIAEFKKLMGGQLGGLRDQYRSSTGREDFDGKLSARTRRALGIDKPTPRGTLSANVPTMTPEQARNAPKGTRFRTTDGRVMVRQ